MELRAGSRAPDTPFTTPDGARTAHDLLEESGGRPVLLVFFKTSCPVCQLDWPYLERLHRAHGESLRVIGVSQDDADASRRYHAAHGKATFELALDPAPAFAASNAYGVESVPHHVLLAPDGLVTKVSSGWSRSLLEDLDGELAARRGKSPAGVVPEGDPVAVFKPG